MHCMLAGCNMVQRGGRQELGALLRLYLTRGIRTSTEKMGIQEAGGKPSKGWRRDGAMVVLCQCLVLKRV